MRLLFCFNDTATTAIYTYLHTLSLHDALPIYPAVLDPQHAATFRAHRHRPALGVPGGMGSVGIDARNQNGALAPIRAINRSTAAGDQPAVEDVQRARAAAAEVADIESACRSEEHTSELQSLLRISYAVF